MGREVLIDRRRETEKERQKKRESKENSVWGPILVALSELHT